MAQVDIENVVIIGGSHAGTGAAHYFLKHITPDMKKKGREPHVYLVTDSTHYYWRPGAPRALVSLDLMPEKKLFHDISEGFKQYDQSHFTIIHGKAVGLDQEAHTIRIEKKDGEQVLPYHALVIATGTRSLSPLTSLWGDHTQTQKALVDMNAKLKTAKSVIISGGGPVGVETAGEIAYHYNGEAGWFASAPANPKMKVTVITSDTKLLPRLKANHAKKAQTSLAKMGADVIYGHKIASTTENADGTTTVKLDNGEEMTADVYLPGHGVTPNTEYLPAAWKNERGYVKTDPKSLRVDEAGPYVYAIGDVATYTEGGIYDMFGAVPVAMHNLRRDLLAEIAKTNKAAEGKDRQYSAMTQIHLVPVGRSKGVGAAFGWAIPSSLVWFVKGRDYMAGEAPPNVDGSRWKKA